MMTEYSDCQWFTDDKFGYYQINGYCLTFIADRTADLVKDILHASVGAVVIGEENSDNLFAARLWDAGNGSVMLEHGGFAAYMHRVATALSRGTRIAVVVDPSFGSSKFAYIENGITICAFDILDPDVRGGSSPDLLLSDLTEAGLLPVDDSEWESEEDESELIEGEGASFEDLVIRTISLASRLTGIPFTRQSEENPRYFISFASLYSSDPLEELIRIHY